MFFDDEMEVLLPAASDIYITGGKTHDSEIRLAKFLIKHLGPGQTFVDIGAHFGYFTLLAAHLVGQNGKVFSIEASRNTYKLLENNTSGMAHIKVMHHAVSDIDEEVTFYEFPVLYSEYNTMDIEKYKNESWLKNHMPDIIEVQAVKIDTLFEDYHIQPDYIKIDVEGAEIQAIKGGSKTWANTSPVVVMEYLSGSGAGDSYKEATGIMKQHNYNTFIITSEGEPEAVTDIDRYMSGQNSTSENIVFIKNNKQAN